MSFDEGQPPELRAVPEQPQFEPWEIKRGHEIAKALVELTLRIWRQEPLIREGIQDYQIREATGIYDPHELQRALEAAQHALDMQSPQEPDALRYDSAA